MSVPLHRLSAIEALNLIKADSISVVTYAQALLDRIEERDSIVNAWVYLDPEFVLNQTRTLDEIPKAARGPLHGLAIGIKDLINTKDMPTQMGSTIYKEHHSNFDASAVGIVSAAGALIFGKTTTTEFGVANSGPKTTNPHDSNRTPGGSSCGSAAAVADFQIALALGAQTGGSLIRPASFTGIFALKPTYNAVSSEGTKMLSLHYDTLGFMARSVEDLQLLADVFALSDDTPIQNMSLDRISVALIKTPMWHRAGPGTIAAMDRSMSILQANGVRVEEVSLPTPLNDSDTLKRIQKVTMATDARVAFFQEYRIDKNNLDPEIQKFVENNANFTHKEALRAQSMLASMRPIAHALAAKYSVIIAPSAIDEAPLGLGDMGSAASNTLWTGFHMLVLNVPAFTGVNGMPIGISSIAGRYHDQHLLRVGLALSEVLGARCS